VIGWMGETEKEKNAIGDFYGSDLILKQCILIIWGRWAIGRYCLSSRYLCPNGTYLQTLPHEQDCGAVGDAAGNHPDLARLL